MVLIVIINVYRHYEDKNINVYKISNTNPLIENNNSTYSSKDLFLIL